MKPYIKKFHSVIWIQAGGHLLTSFTAVILLPFLTLHLYNQTNHNVLQATLIIGIQPLAEFLLTITLGGWVDRFSRRTILLSSMIIQITALSGFAFADGFIAFGLLNLLNACGRFIYIPAARAQVTDITPLPHRAEAFAILSTADSVGALCGPILGALLFKVSPALMFLASAALLLVYLFIAAKLLPETYQPAHLEHAQRNEKFKWSRHSLLLWLMIGSLPLSLFHSQMETNWPLYLKNHFIHDIFIFSMLSTIGNLLFIGLEIYIVNKSAKISLVKIVLGSYFLYTAAAIGFGFSHHAALFIPAEILFTLGAIMSLNRLQSVLSIIAPPQFMARYFAIYGSHWDISRALGPVAGGWILAKTGGYGLFLSLILALLAGASIQARTVRRIEKQYDVHSVKNVS